MTTSELMKAMSDAGAPFEAILIAIQALEAKDAELAAREAEIAQKRASNAERQQRFRERRGERKDAGSRRIAKRNVMSNVTDNVTDNVTPPIDNTHTPQPVSNETVKTTARAIAHKLPADFEPILTAAAQRIVDGWPPGKLAAELSAFRDHAADKGRTSKDWQAAFRTWLTNANRWTRNEPRTNTPGRTTGGQGFDRRSTLARAIDEGLEHLDWLEGRA